MQAVLGSILVIAAGILPMVVYALVLWWFDRYEKEPLGLLLAAFAWGAVPAAVFSFVTEQLLGIPIGYFVDPAAADRISATLIAPLTEETYKGIALLLLLVFFHREIDSPLDGIIYGGLVGFGFAAVENVLYLGNELAFSGVGGFLALAVLRAFVFGLNHALFTGLTGLGLALARTSPKLGVRMGAPVVGLALGMAAHGVHNLSVGFADQIWPCLFTFLSDGGGVVVLLAVIIWSTWRERQWIATYLADEVERGTLSRRDYETACSATNRWVERANALFGGDFRRWWALSQYYRLATELAFNKRRLAQFPGEQQTRTQVAWLRQQVMAQGERL